MTNCAAIVQMMPLKGNKHRNIEQMIFFVRQAKTAKPDVRLILFPEMCTTGYIFSGREEILPVCESAEGETFNRLKTVCIELGIYLAYGFAEIDNDLLYNSQNLISPEGKLLYTYRKVHLFDADKSWAASGSSFLTVDTELGRLGPGICMDLNFDDFTDYHIEAETDIILFSANWLYEGVPIHRYWLMRLYGYDNTTLIANRYGIEEGTEFCGWSSVVRDGAVEQTVDLTGDGIIIAAL